MNPQYEVSVYIDVDGKIYSTSTYNANLVSFLKKLDIKSANHKIFATFTMPSSGNYTITSHNHNNSHYNITVTSVPIPRVKPAKAKNYLKPSKDQKKQWRSSNKTHSINTGRKIGGR